MMKTTLRSASKPQDLAAMIALATSSVERNLHVVDLPYRLASWALDDAANGALWEDGRGRLAAWAVLQAPFWAIDFALRPDAEFDLLPRVLEWADRRARAVRGTVHERPAWYVHVFSDADARCGCLEEFGFACQSDAGNDSWSRVLLERRGTVLPPIHRPEFSVRPVRNEADVAAYVELHGATFGTKNMTAEWRKRTFTAAHHLADADLVAVTPDGQPVGFCVGWFFASLGLGQIEPMGIAKEHRERGIGSALLAECLHRLAGCGARVVLVETDTYRTPALGLYEGLGFTPARDVLVYRKEAPHAG